MELMKRMNGIKSTLQIDKCRVCGRVFFEEPLCRFQNMPAVAQYLPDADSLKDDKGVDLEVYQCSVCGLVQLSNKPVHYYREVIRASGFSEEMKEFRLKQFDKFVKQYSLEGKKIIEIGCGRGEYLSVMSQCGVKAFGLEYSEDSAIECKKNNLEVSKGFVEGEEYKIDNAPFDAFFILSFLEHLPDPNAILRGVYNNLSDDAVGIVEVPNFDMMLRKNLFSEFMRDHLFYFTKETLNIILALNGFEIISCGEVWHGYIVSAVVRKRKKLDLSLFHQSQEKINKEVAEYISRFNIGKVAVWGAGHQSFAVLSLLGLGGKIRYVVDSAPFKQGKFAPSTHIPIVSPDKLSSDPVEAIIIMAGSYSDEVLRIVREKFDVKMDIAILRESGLEIK